MLSVAISPFVLTLEFPRTGNLGLKRSLFLFGGDVDGAWFPSPAKIDTKFGTWFGRLGTSSSSSADDPLNETT